MKKYTSLFGALCLGAGLGTAAKYLDTISADETMAAHVLNYLADLFTRTGIWVLAAVLLAVGSRTVYYAAGNVFCFFAGMLAAYYVYSSVLFGFFPTRYFIFWGILGLVGAAGAPLLWLGRHCERGAWILPALPMGLLLNMSFGYGRWYLHLSYPDTFFMFLIVCMIYYKKPKQLALNIIMAFAVAVIVKTVLPFSL